MTSVRAGLAHDLLASAQATEDRALEFWANLVLLHVSFEAGDFARAQVLRDRQQELAVALAQPTLSWIAQLEVAAWALVEGDFAAGEERGKRGARARQPRRPAGRAPGLRRAAGVRAALPGARRRATDRVEQASRRRSPSNGGMGRVDRPVRSAFREPRHRPTHFCALPSRTGSSRSDGTRCGLSRSRSTPMRHRVSERAMPPS